MIQRLIVLALSYIVGFRIINYLMLPVAIVFMFVIAGLSFPVWVPWGL